MILNKGIINETEVANLIIGKTVQRGHLGLVLYWMVKNLHFALPQFTFSEVIKTFGSFYFLDVLHKMKSRD